MKILVACEYSGIVSEAFRNKGHEVWSCDILESEKNNDWHIKGDVLEVLNDGWDMMIAHPPCTYLANSGVRWLYRDIDRWPKMFEGAEFFKRLMNAPINKKVIENPIMHKYAKSIIGKGHTQLIQPWHMGDNESKAICLWIEGLNKLEKIVHDKPLNLEQRVWKMPPSPERQKERSRFFKGVAKAMADQWG